jgi:hypothetical protein
LTTCCKANRGPAGVCEATTHRLALLAIERRDATVDWLPTFVEIGGGPKGNDLKGQIEKGAYPGIVKTTLDGVNQIDYLTGKSQESARDVFYYFAGPVPAAVRYKNWKMYYQMPQAGAEGWLLPPVPLHWTGVQNILRDPFEQAVGFGQKSAFSLGGALAAPSTAYVYDWNMLPIGQQLWLHDPAGYDRHCPGRVGLCDRGPYDVRTACAGGPRGISASRRRSCSCREAAEPDCRPDQPTVPK